jgi:heptosyltransferase-2
LSADAVAFADAWAASLPEPGKMLIGVNAGGGWITKRWGVKSFAAFADRAAGELNATIAVFWGPGEEADARELQELMTQAAVVLPKTTLQQSAACIKRCSLFVSNDSGPMHIAAALDVPTLGIFGPTNPQLQGPFGPNNLWVRNEAVPCLGCNLTACTIGNVCMTELTPQTVYRAFEQLMAKNNIHI